MRIKPLAASTALLALVFTAPAAAKPADGDLLPGQAGSAAELRTQVDRHLALAPGGVRTAPNEISYDGGRFVVTFAQPGVIAQGVPDCPSGWYCFYDHVNYGYPRGKLSSPGWQDLAEYGWYNRVESVHNNTDLGVDFIDHTNVGHFPDHFLFWVPAFSTNSDVAPYRNTADHVNRY